MDGFASIRLPRLAVTEVQESRVETQPTLPVVKAEVEVTDEDLIAEVCRGSREALALLFRRYARLVQGVALRVLKDSSEADDLLQDIFLLIDRLCRTFDSSKAPARFWILQMTYRRAISRRRYLSSRHFYTHLDLDDPELQLPDSRTQIGHLGETIDGNLGKLNLSRAFEALSEDQRQTLWLHFVEGYTLDEIAKMLGQSKGNIRHHSFRGLERLRKQIFGGKLPGTRAV